MQAFLAQQIAAAALRYAPAVVNDVNYNEFVSYLEALSVPDEAVFGGIATPWTSPPRISLPTIYLAVMGGTYKAFSSLGVDEGVVALFGGIPGEPWELFVSWPEPTPLDDPAAILAALTVNSEASTLDSASDLTKTEAASALGISQDALDSLFAGKAIRFAYTAATLGVMYVSEEVVVLGGSDSVRVTIAKSGDAYAIAVTSHDFSEDFSEDLNS